MRLLRRHVRELRRAARGLPSAAAITRAELQRAHLLGANGWPTAAGHAVLERARQLEQTGRRASD